MIIRRKTLEEIKEALLESEERIDAMNKDAFERNRKEDEAKRAKETSDAFSFAPNAIIAYRYITQKTEDGNEHRKMTVYLNNGSQVRFDDKEAKTMSEDRNFKKATQGRMSTAYATDIITMDLPNDQNKIFSCGISGINLATSIADTQKPEAKAKTKGRRSRK